MAQNKSYVTTDELVSEIVRARGKRIHEIVLNGEIVHSLKIEWA